MVRGTECVNSERDRERYDSSVNGGMAGGAADVCHFASLRIRCTL